MQCSCAPAFYDPPLADTCYGGTFILFMSIIDTLLRNKCDLTEMCQRITPRHHPDPEYDFVVIGGGSAGSVVAGRLSEVRKWKVLLLEAGGDEPSASQIPSMMMNFLGNSHIDWNYKTEPQERACLGFPERRCIWPRGKVLGGSGVLHGMMYMRGPPKDYDDWEKMGNPGWRYEKVMEHFKKSEGNQDVGSLVSGELHGTKGPMVTTRFPDHPVLADDVMKAAKELSYPVVKDLNEGRYTGFTIAQVNTKNGTRLSSARAFLRPARNRQNLHIMIDSLATKITINATERSKKPSKVKFFHKNHLYTVKVRKEVILSAGAINSPQLLLLSGIGPKEELQKAKIRQIHNLPGVGRNFQNHVSFGVPFKLNLKEAKNDLDWGSVYQYMFFNKGPMSSTGMAQVTARVTTRYENSSENYPDLQLFFEGYLANCSRFGMIGEKSSLLNFKARKTFVISPVVLRPKSRGYIGLKTNNPLDPPFMQPNYLTDMYDIKILIEGIRLAQKLCATKILREKYGCEMIKEDYGSCSEKHSFDSDQFWECAIRFATRPENHQSSSCKMGPSSDSMAVVDSKLRVHGIDGLRVMDASIMPTVVSGNPHATIVMIAEKGVDHVKKKWLNNS